MVGFALTLNTHA